MEPHQLDMIRGRSLNVAGKLTFLYGGEFHYFRIPRLQWNDRLKKAGFFLSKGLCSHGKLLNQKIPPLFLTLS